HRQIFRLLVAAERAADVDACVLELELADRPHRLLHVGRRVAAPDFDHSFTPSLRVSSILSWPGLSRPSRLVRHGFAHLSEIAGPSPAMTNKVCGQVHSSLRASSGSMMGMPSRIG